MDDRPLGRLLSRREAMRWLGGGAAWLITGPMLVRGVRPAERGLSVSSAQSRRKDPILSMRNCVDPNPSGSDHWRSQTRSTIGVDCSTLPCRSWALPAASWCARRHLALRCAWIYSDVKDPQFDTTGRKFLRGYQLTDAQGEAKFLTIYPGWYYGRTVHIHIKVRAIAGAKQTFEFTSQMYFEDSLWTASIPRLRRAGQRTARIDVGSCSRGGNTRAGAGPTADGYAATFAASLQLPPG